MVFGRLCCHGPVTFLSPGRLWLLVPVVALAVAYLVLQYRRGWYAARFADAHLLRRLAVVATGRAGGPRALPRSAWRRHLPAVLLLATLALLTVGFARPADEVLVPRERATVIIAVDVSRSMLATDVDPDRLTAAAAAASEFAAGLPQRFNVGLVAFAASASVLVAPGTDRDAVQAGIARLGEPDLDAAGPGGTGPAPGGRGGRGTAIGEAIATALQAVHSLDAQAAQEPPPARVVLLSDGNNTAGRPPAQAAAQAGEAGVPVDTISFGTSGGQLDTGGRVLRVPVDSDTLREVADLTGGGFHEAATSEQLRAVYDDIGSSVGYRSQRRDISTRFIGLGLLAALAGAGASLAWSSRLP